jgi:hypothetical protein
MMEKEEISKIFVSNSTLTQLIAQEDFSTSFFSLSLTSSLLRYKPAHYLFHPKQSFMSTFILRYILLFAAEQIW